MAGRPIELNLDANVRDAVKGIDDVADAVKDLSDAFVDGGKDSERAVDDLEDKLRDLTREAERVGDKAGDGIGDGFRKGTKKAGAGLDDLKGEAGQSGREAAASFSGGFDDVTDFVQETVANGLGPAGIAGAALIGAVVAVATQAVEQWNEKIQGIKDATASMWQAAAEDGQLYVDRDAILAEAHRINWDKAYEEDRKAAERAGISKSDLAIALAEGEGEVFDRVHQQFMKARDEEAAKTQENYDKYTSGADGVIQLEGVHEQQIDRTIAALDEKAKATELNKEKAQDAADAAATLGEEERNQISRTNSASQARWDAEAARVEAARANAAKGINIPVNVQTGGADDLMTRLRAKWGAPVTIVAEFKKPNGERFIP